MPRAVLQLLEHWLKLALALILRRPAGFGLLLLLNVLLASWPVVGPVLMALLAPTCFVAGILIAAHADHQDLGGGARQNILLVIGILTGMLTTGFLVVALITLGTSSVRLLASAVLPGWHSCWALPFILMFWQPVTLLFAPVMVLTPCTPKQAWTASYILYGLQYAYRPIFLSPAEMLQRKLTFRLVEVLSLGLAALTAFASRDLSLLFGLPAMILAPSLAYVVYRDMFHNRQKNEVEPALASKRVPLPGLGR